MSASAAIRRLRFAPTTVRLLLPAVEPLAPHLLGALLSWEALALRPVLRVGDYEVGEIGCPRLCGHPGIRY